MNVIYRELTHEHLPDIKPLWKMLNEHHGKRSSNFKSHYKTFTFEARCAQILNKEILRIFVAYANDELIGYCIASIDDMAGEVESIFIHPQWQCKGTGSVLMQNALNWLHQQHCQKITVAVAEGNEAAGAFYEKFGFQKRLTIMQITV